ncbi:MAG TPA: hypothetical protein VHN15_13540, partial [Thermoanaerobaculia bacterium]|nr:hypothetical protein [Thermoanaerobaculia bacterium]
MTIALKSDSSPSTRLVPPLWAELPDFFAARLDPEAPWTLLGDALDELLAGLPSSDIQGQVLPDVHLVGDRIVICPGARLPLDVRRRQAGQDLVQGLAEQRPGSLRIEA